MSKIFDSWESEYKSHFGAMSRGATCTFNVRIPKLYNPDVPPVMVTFRTGYRERFITMLRLAETDEYVEYSTTYTPVFVGIHYYYFYFTVNAQKFFIKREGASEGVINEHGALWQLTVYEHSYTTPEFLKGGTMYQIFPDRFYRSGREHEGVPEDRILRDDWGGQPNFRPDEQGIVRNNDYFGGDLEGIIMKLPYLDSLGVTCIYLNPIFEAHENHRYNTADYRKVDPLLGTNDDFKRLCAEAKKYGISVVLDGVFSHTGADSIYFNKYNRYETQGAYNSKSSPYYRWYTFTDYPDSYESWWGFSSLPNVNECNEEYIRFICEQGGVLDYWLGMGAQGFRLDVADELPDEFLYHLNVAVKGFSSEKIIIGEVWEDATNKESYGVKRTYLLGSQLDSTMNYPFRTAVIKYLLGGSAAEFRDTVMTILENYPKPSVDVLMNFVSTHDVERTINLLGSPECAFLSKEEQSVYALTEGQYAKGRSLLKCAYVLAFFLPGVPSVYYGDEAGMQGGKDPFNRGCYPWGGEDAELLEFIRELGAMRKKCKLLRDGKFMYMYGNDDLFAFMRYNSRNNGEIIVLNKSSWPKTIFDKLNINRNTGEWHIVRGKKNTSGRIEIPPHDYALIYVDDYTLYE